jgi:hypothetical protein
MIHKPSDYLFHPIYMLSDFYFRCPSPLKRRLVAAITSAPTSSRRAAGLLPRVPIGPARRARAEFSQAL